MIEPLRRVHRRAFVVLAIVLSVILFAGLRGRRARVTRAPAPEAPFGRPGKLP